MSMCRFLAKDGEACCQRCGFTTKVPIGVDSFTTECQRWNVGLGDRTAWILKYLGVTPVRYVKVRNKLIRVLLGKRPPATCGCVQRQHWLNLWGAKIARIPRKFLQFPKFPKNS